MHCLIVGGDSSFGMSLRREMQNLGHVVSFTSRRKGAKNQLDLSVDIAAWEPPAQYDVAFLCAAIPSIELCEKAPELTRRVNVDNTILVGEKLHAGGSRVIFPSTNVVFDGSQPFPEEDDICSPLTEYGRQKCEVGDRLLLLGDRVAIIRFTKVAPSPMPLLAGWRKDLQEGEVVAPFHDVYFSPVPLAFAMEATAKIALDGGGGVWHISGDKDISYAEAAALIAKGINVPPSLVRPSSIMDSGIAGAAPIRYSALGCNRLERDFGLSIPSVEDTILAASF